MIKIYSRLVMCCWSPIFGKVYPVDYEYHLLLLLCCLNWTGMCCYLKLFAHIPVYQSHIQGCSGPSLFPFCWSLSCHCIDLHFHVDFTAFTLSTDKKVFPFLKRNCIIPTVIFESTFWCFACFISKFVHNHHIVIRLVEYKLCNIETRRKFSYQSIPDKSNLFYVQKLYD